MDFKAITFPFLSILLAEFGDKTQLAILCLSSKTRHHLSLMWGCISGFVIVDGLSIILGNYLGRKLPIPMIKIASGVFFIVLGILLIYKGGQEEDFQKCDGLRNPFWSGLSIIFFSEMGDKTQLMAGIFATQYQAVAVFIGTILALSLLSGLTIYLGRKLSEKISPQLLSRIAGLIFIIMGLINFFILIKFKCLK